FRPAGRLERLQFGCSDRWRLALHTYPRYLSSTSVPMPCSYAINASHMPKNEVRTHWQTRDRADLFLSLGVILHLVEDDVYDQCLRGQFDSAAVRGDLHE